VNCPNVKEKSVNSIYWHCNSAEVTFFAIQKANRQRAYSVIFIQKWSSRQGGPDRPSPSHIVHIKYVSEWVSEWVSQSVSPSVLALSPPGNHDHIVAVVKTFVALLSGTSLIDRTGLSCNRSQSLSVLAINTYVHFLVFYKHLCIINFPSSFVHSSSSSSSSSYACQPSFVQQIMLITHTLLKDITTG
jgi:hypothetical protein